MKNIKVGIIGLGSMGKGLLYQTLITDGIKTAAICDLDLKKVYKTLDEFNLEFQHVDDCDQLDNIINTGKIAVFNDGEKLAQMRGLDAVVEATGAIISGIRHSKKAITTGKHVILMNSEVDLIAGVYLGWLANQNHVICTSCDGDQYGVLKHLIDDIKFWGFELVMAGNMKGYLDRYANPTSIIPEADKRNLDYKACASYTDGTKLNIEMALIANALGLVTKVKGMCGPVCKDIEEVNGVFDYHSLWTDRKPFVDYVLGAKPGPGVFAIGYCDNAYQRSMMKYYKMGDGPYYLFYRPYHLCHVESMSTIIDAVENNKILLRPEYGFITNVYAYAKKNLRKGDKLDGIGGYTCYGLIENCSEQGDSPGVPICLADQVTLNRDILKDEKILMEDIEYDAQRIDFDTFRLSTELGGLAL